MRKWLFPKKMSAVTPPEEKPKMSRHKDWDWTLREGCFDSGGVAVQVLQDLRDELKKLNKRMDSLEENFKLVFGIEEKNDGED